MQNPTMAVILNEVKNLDGLIGDKSEILRLTPQNEIATESHGKIQIGCKELKFGKSTWIKVIDS